MVCPDFIVVHVYAVQPVAFCTDPQISVAFEDGVYRFVAFECGYAFYVLGTDGIAEKSL